MKYVSGSGIGPAGSCHLRTSAAKAFSGNKGLIAAVNRCATQKQVQRSLFPQAVEPNFRVMRYRSGKPLRHPKLGAAQSFLRKR
jgi:hypothetical protein